MGPLYQLEKDGKLSGEGDVNGPGAEFIRGQMLKAGALLGNLWWTAWQQAGPDTYLKARIIERKDGRGPKQAAQKP